MRRREFITLLGGVTAWPLAARAQQPVMPTIGFLNNTSVEIRRDELAAFHRGLNETGYTEGRNVRIEYRWAEGRYDRLPMLATELVRAGSSVLVATGGEPVALAAKAAASTLPIVFIIAGDPVKLGLVASFNRPGGNVTGYSLLATQLETKRLEVARDLVPGAAVIAFLMNPRNPITETATKDLQTAADKLGQKLLVVEASTERELDAAFMTAVQQRAGAMLIEGDGFLFAQRGQIIALAARHAVPTVSGRHEYTRSGGLMSYGSSITEGYRQAGAYTGRILKGAKPADLPVQQSAKIELIINRTTAKALGLTIPDSLLLRADEVIE